MIATNNRMTTSSMSISTFSPRTTQNNSTTQFTEFADERYNRSEYLSNIANIKEHEFNSNSDLNQTQYKNLNYNGLSYNNLNSNSSFLLKSKENFTEDNAAAFNKYVAKYNSNNVFTNTNGHAKSPREKKGYLYVFELNIYFILKYN